ncbi:AraC family transcriptional regulator [Glycomyces tarimensis]
MDPLSELLSGIRAAGAVISEAVLEAPWALLFEDRAPLTMVTLARGGGTLVLADGSEVPIRGGQTAVVRGEEPFRLVDNGGAPGRTLTEYELSCFEPDATCTAEDLGNGKWGNDPQGATSLFVGAYRASGRRHEWLLRALPPVVVIDDGSEVCAWLEAAAMDVAARRPGTQALIDRLFDWGLVCTLRTWFDQEGNAAPSWYRGFADPVAGPALEAIHSRPFKQWTVASLAAEAGVSRALFAKRFTEIMGEPPLRYLTEWRMEVAEEMLADPETTVAQVARAVGYADAFGFSSAFKRRRGVSPSEYRAGTVTSSAPARTPEPAAG